jgi:hypothetical protein
MAAHEPDEQLRPSDHQPGRADVLRIRHNGQVWSPAVSLSSPSFYQVGAEMNTYDPPNTTCMHAKYAFTGVSYTGVQSTQFYATPYWPSYQGANNFNVIGTA